MFPAGVGAVALVLAGCRAEAPPPPPAAVAVLPIEALPEARLATMAARDQTLAAARLGTGATPVAVQRRARRWVAGSTLRVAIRGGDARLHRQIADVAAQWSLHGNIGFDFGDGGGAARSWSPNDTRYTAQIRIGFEEPGYFSCIGDESINPACAAPGQASMNLHRFDRELPPIWRSIVLHAFGHALGLEHHHAATSPECADHLRWEDDPGYVRTVDREGRLARDGSGRWPGIYSVLSGPPYGWGRARVDQVLRQPHAAEPHAGRVTGPGAVMGDEPAEWMLRAGRASRCFSPRPDRLSLPDQRAIAALYPRGLSDVVDAVRRHQAALAAIRDADRLSPPIRRFVEERLLVLEARRPLAVP